MALKLQFESRVRCTSHDSLVNVNILDHIYEVWSHGPITNI